MATYGMQEASIRLSFTEVLFWLQFRYPYGTSQQGNTLVLIHDAFQPLSYWNGFMTGSNWQGVAMDTHIYQMFSVAVSDRQSIFIDFIQSCS